MKQKQLEIILKYNPCNDNFHTWIRTIDDIKSFEEALNDGDYSCYDEYAPDFTRQDALKAIAEGCIVVYSSHPISRGIFVTPSKIEALSYSSNGRIYSKLVKLTDVAWIDVTQSQ
ncbi:hypothetical protein [Huintestinicola sp.]|uniref:hypothetical protein n=1 Tax=Huintestinicola sp. TaxID=2981661 RepID=UPI003D7E602D